MSQLQQPGLTQAEFARRRGWAKSYVTKLKQDGRLVLSDGGLVLEQESLARIHSTTGAPERAAPEVQGAALASSQERERFYSSELKRLEYEERIGQLRPAADLHSAIRDAGTTIRGRVEGFRDRLPARIAALGGDEQRIGALMAGECEALLSEMVGAFAKMAAAERPDGAGAAP